MGTRARSLIVLSVCMVMTAAGVAVLVGCPEKPPATPPTPAVNPKAAALAKAKALFAKAETTSDPFAAAQLFLEACTWFTKAEDFFNAEEAYERAVAKLEAIELQNPSFAVQTELQADMAAACFLGVSKSKGRQHLAKAVQSSASLDIDAPSVRALARLGVAQHTLEDPAASKASLAKGEKLTGLIEDPISRARALLSVAKAYREIGNKAAEKRIETMAQTQTNGIGDALKRSEALIWIALDQLEQANMAGAKGTIQQAEKAAGGIANPLQRGNARVKMGFLLLTGGRKNDALRLAKQAEQDADKVTDDPDQRKRLYEDIDRLRN